MSFRYIPNINTRRQSGCRDFGAEFRIPARDAVEEPLQTCPKSINAFTGVDLVDWQTINLFE